MGLKFKLFSAEVLFNKGLSQIYMGRAQEGLADMEEARRDKATDEHNVIDDAIQDRGEGYTVFSIVSPKIFCYLGQALILKTSLSEYCIVHLTRRSRIR